jgi:hypothetical protein
MTTSQPTRGLLDEALPAKEGQTMMMTSEYRGVPYAVPNTDDGNWRWVIYAVAGRKSLVSLNAQPRPVYPTRDAAVQAVKCVIDDGLKLRDSKPGAKR